MVLYLGPMRMYHVIDEMCHEKELLENYHQPTILAHRLSYCDNWMSVVHRLLSTIASKDISVLAGFCPNLAGRNLIWPPLMIVQMVLVCSISRSHWLIPQGLIFCMC